MLNPHNPSHFSPRMPLRFRLIRAFIKSAAKILFDVRVSGATNIPRGNCIVVANHLNWLDAFLLMIVMPAEPRLYFIGAQRAANTRWKEWLMGGFDGWISFELGAAWVGKDIFKKPLEVLDSGASLALFPEGNLGEREGELQSIQRGIGHILLRADYAILPIAVSGVKELYWRKTVKVVVGEPFFIDNTGLDRRAAIAHTVARVENSLRALIPPYDEPIVQNKRVRFLTNLLG